MKETFDCDNCIVTEELTRSNFSERMLCETCKKEEDQAECDHDWEVFESEGVKQCTYPECQLERKLDSQDYEDLELRE